MDMSGTAVKPPKFIERSKLLTPLMVQSAGFISDMWQNSPIALSTPNAASIFTSTQPMDAELLLPKAGIVYEAQVRDITTLYDSYLRKTDLVVLLDCPAIRQRQSELMALGYESVYRTEEPCLVLSENVPQLTAYINAFINGLKDFVARRRGNLTLYFHGEELAGSFGYPFDPTASANEQALSQGKGYVRPEGLVHK